jgi:Tfp pilus assembly protein FimT
MVEGKGRKRADAMNTTIAPRRDGGADRSPAAAPSTLHLRRRGFTLLELLVVIFIMMLMATMAVVSFRHYLDTERIKLAGGTVDSAIRLARQYAMSKRTQCMVEFVNPIVPTKTDTVTLTPTEWAWCTAGKTGENTRNTVFSASTHDINFGQAYNNSGNSRIFIRFPMPTVNPTDTVMSAKLVLDCTRTLDVDAVFGPTVSTWSLSTLTFNNAPSLTQVLQTLQIRTASKHFEQDVDDLLLKALDASATDLCFGVIGTAGGTIWNRNSGTTIDTVKLVVQVQRPTATAADTASRFVRILPYKRMISATTGGFTWLLDEDVNSLKVMELPKNIHFVLTPAKTSLLQYDPVEADKSTPVAKVFVVLSPDGSSSASPPKVTDTPPGTLDHWKSFTNAVILRDAATDDLCLLYVPPATSFTRQRYLFAGAEVDDFLKAHSPYTLW